MARCARCAAVCIQAIEVWGAGQRSRTCCCVGGHKTVELSSRVATSTSLRSTTRARPVAASLNCRRHKGACVVQASPVKSAAPRIDSLAPQAESGPPTDEASARLSQLEGRLQLRRLYKKLVAARALLDTAQAAREGDPSQSLDEELLAAVARIDSAQQLAAGLQSALAQLRAGGLATVYGDSDSSSVEAVLTARVEADFEALTKQAAAWLAALPYRSISDARSAADEALDRLPDEARTIRLVKGEQGARIKAELELLREQPLEAIQGVAEFSKAVWARLNGMDSRSTMPAALAGLPLPPALRSAHESRLVQCSLDVEAADAALTEAAATREATLKRRDSSLRLPLAREVRELDAAVRDARAVLAVRTLQLESARMYAALEDEVCEVGDTPAARDGDVALIIAEYGALDARVQRCAGLIERGETALLPDDDLDALVRDCGELAGRLGLAEDASAATKDLSVGKLLERVQRSARETGSKVSEGAEFVGRGVRLLGEDVSNSASLFSRVLLGTTLKPREVQALRRTSRDVLTFVPFIIILVAPITPVGHVLVFSFLQRYFPGLFPSQFTQRRQDLYRKYEELRSQLAAAEEAAVAATEAAALKRAAEVVAALTRGDGLPDDVDATVKDLQERTNEVAKAVNSE